MTVQQAERWLEGSRHTRQLLDGLGVRLEAGGPLLQAFEPSAGDGATFITTPALQVAQHRAGPGRPLAWGWLAGREAQAVEALTAMRPGATVTELGEELLGLALAGADAPGVESC